MDGGLLRDLRDGWAGMGVKLTDEVFVVREALGGGHAVSAERDSHLTAISHGNPNATMFPFSGIGQTG